MSALEGQGLLSGTLFLTQHPTVLQWLLGALWERCRGHLLSCSMASHGQFRRRAFSFWICGFYSWLTHFLGLGPARVDSRGTQWPDSCVRNSSPHFGGAILLCRCRNPDFLTPDPAGPLPIVPSSCQLVPALLPRSCLSRLPMAPHHPRRSAAVCIQSPGPPEDGHKGCPHLPIALRPDVGRSPREIQRGVCQGEGSQGCGEELRALWRRSGGAAQSRPCVPECTALSWVPTA